MSSSKHPHEPPSGARRRPGAHLDDEPQPSPTRPPKRSIGSGTRLKDHNGAESHPYSRSHSEASQDPSPINNSSPVDHVDDDLAAVLGYSPKNSTKPLLDDTTPRSRKIAPLREDEVSLVADEDIMSFLSDINLQAELETAVGTGKAMAQISVNHTGYSVGASQCSCRS